MEKKLILTALLVLSLCFVLVFADNVKSAYALTLSNIIISGAGSSHIYYYPTAQRYILNQGAGVIGNINPTTKAHSTVTLTSVAPDSYDTGLYCTTGVGCYISESSGSLPDNIYLFNPLTGARLQTYTVSTSGADINIAGISTVSSNANLNKDGWYQASCTAGGSIIFNVQGVVLGDCAGTNFGANNVYAVEAIGSFVGITTASATNSFQVWSTATLSRVCQVNVNVSGGGSVESYNSNFYVVVGTNTINKYNTACTAGTSLTGHGISSQIFGLQAITYEGVMAVEGTTSIAYMNLTSNNISTLSYTVVTNFTETATTIRNDRLVYASGFNQTGAMIDVTGTSDPFLFVQYVPAGSGASTNTPTTGIDCTQPENANILICRLGGTGELASAGAFVVGNVTQGTGVLGIGCSIGLVDCTSDSNPQTNGLGYLIFIASIFVIIGMFYRSLGANATFHMPIYIWAVIILSLSAFFTITHIIDPTMLILTVIALVALAVPKVGGYIQGGFGGDKGSSA